MALQGLVARGVPPFPRWLLFAKVAIILLSQIILALAAYAISLYSGYFSFYYSSGVPGYLIFLAIKSWVIYGISIALELKAPQFYYRMVFLIAYILTVIFWLSGWAWSASWAAYVMSFYSSYNIGDTYKTFGSVMAACAALGAVVWVLCIVNLVFFILASIRNPDSSNNVELGRSQKQGQRQNQTGYPQQQYQPQQGYSQQAYPPQTYSSQ